MISPSEQGGPLPEFLQQAGEPIEPPRTTAGQTAALWGPEEKYRAELKRRGLDGVYNDYEGIIDKETLDRKMRREMFLMDQGYEPKDITAGYARAQFLEQHGQKHMPDHEFDRFLGDKATYAKTEQDVMQQSYEFGAAEAVKGDEESFKKWFDSQEDENLKGKGAAAYASARWKFREFKPYAEMAGELREAILKGELGKVDDVSSESFAKFADLKGGELNKLLQTIALLHNMEGGSKEEASLLWEGLRKMGRFGKEVVRSSGGFTVGRNKERELRKRLASDKLFIPEGEDFSSALEADRIHFSAERSMKAGVESGKLVRRPLDEAETKIVKDVARAQIGYIRLMRQLSGLQNQLDPLLDDGFWQKAAGVFIDSVGYIGLSINPATAGAVIFPMFSQQAEAELELRAPDLSLEKRQNLSMIIGAGETAVARAQALTLGMKVPGLSAKLQKLTGNKTVDYFARVVQNTTLEVGQELLEEEVSEFVLNVAHAFDEEVPEGRVVETMQQFMGEIGPMAVGMLPLVMLGSGVGVNMNAELAAALEPVMGVNVLKINGFSDAQIADINSRPKGERAARMVEVAQETDADTMAENRAKALQDPEVVEEARKELSGEKEFVENADENQLQNDLERNLDSPTDLREEMEEDPMEFRLDKGEKMGIAGMLPKTEMPAAFKWMARKLRGRGNLPQKAFEAKNRGDAMFQAMIAQTDLNYRRFKKLTKKLTSSRVERTRLEKQVWRVLTDTEPGSLLNFDPIGKAVNDGVLPAELEQVVRDMREHIDALSTEMEARGFVSGELADIVLENRGTYLNRSYRKFDDTTKWKKEITEEVKENARVELRKEYEQREGETDADYAKRIDGVIESILSSGESSPGALFGKTKMGRTDRKNLKTRKELPDWFRALLGERTEGGEVYYRTVHKMAHQIANYQFLTETRNALMGEVFFEPDPDTGKSPDPAFPEQIVAEGNPSLAPLDGLYTTTEIAAAFKEVMNTNVQGWVRALAKLNAMAKFSKTVLSPITQVRNFTSNVYFLMANGNLHGLGKPGAATKSVMRNIFPRTALNEDGTLKDAAFESYFLKITRLGLFDSAVAGELRAILNDSLVGEMDLVEFSQNRIARYYKKSGEAAAKIYQGGDAFWKVINFEAERAKYKEADPSLSESELDSLAARITRDQLPTYSLVAEGVQDLRRFPIFGNFVSFSAEVIRNNKNILQQIKREMGDSNPKIRAIGRKRLAGMVAAHTLPWMIAGSMRLAMGIDDEEEDAVRALAAPWDRDSQLLYLPSPSGRIRFVNMSYSDPFAMFKKPIYIFKNLNDPTEAAVQSFKSVFEPFMSEEMAASAIIDWMRNTTKDGTQVYDEFAPEHEQYQDIAAHIWDTIEPNFIKQFERIGYAVTDTKKGSRSYNVSDELIGLTTGNRIVEVDPQESVFWKAKAFAQQKREAALQFSYVARKQGTVKDKELRNGYLNMITARKQVYEDFQDAMMAAQVLGVSRDDVETTVSPARPGKADTEKLLDGEIPSWSPSHDLKKAIRGIEGREDQIKRAIPEIADDL